jgi:hypothetical protein
LLTNMRRKRMTSGLGPEVRDAGKGVRIAGQSIGSTLTIEAP